MFTYPITATSSSELVTLLEGFWEFEQASNTTQTDSTPNGWDWPKGSNGGYTSKTGVVNNCVGTTFGQMTRTYNASWFALHEESFTYAGWAKINDNTGNPVLLSIGSVDTNFQIYVDSASGDLIGKLRCGSGSYYSHTLQAAASLATWYFFAFYYDKAAGEIGGSINGAGLTSTTAETSAYPYGGTGVSFIFSHNSGAWWDGDIDQLGLWTGVLSSADVSRLYNGGSGLSYADLILL